MFFYSLFDVDYIVMLMLYMCNANALVGTVVSPSLIPLTRLSYLNYTHILRKMHANCANHEGSKKINKKIAWMCVACISRVRDTLTCVASISGSHDRPTHGCGLRVSVVQYATHGHL